jgi:UTP:GlnB (protein PII) uridylyltransferase
MGTSEVRFTERINGVVSLLEVATHERRSVLALIRGLLFDLRIEIVRVESVVQGAGLLERFDLVEPDGAPITRKRARAIRVAVKRALRQASVAA